jgi:hypothetical protein
MLNRNSPVYGARRRANTGIYFGEEKGIKTEVGEVHEASKKNRDNVDKQVYPQGFISAHRG